MSRSLDSCHYCEGGHRHPKTQLQSVTYSRHAPSEVVWIGIFLLAGIPPSPYPSPLLSAHSNVTKSRRLHLSPRSLRSFRRINHVFLGNLSCPTHISTSLSRPLTPIPISLEFIPRSFKPFLKDYGIPGLISSFCPTCIHQLATGCPVGGT